MSEKMSLVNAGKYLQNYKPGETPDGLVCQFK